MLSAFSRLLQIAIFTLFGLSFALFGLQWLGSKQKYAPVEHPLLRHAFIWVGTSPAQSQDSAIGLQKWRLRLNADRQWQIEENGIMQPLPEVKNQAGLWLEVIDPTAADRLKQLSEYIKTAGLTEQVVFSSAFQSITREMRKIEPMWLYASSVAEGAKVRFLTSLFLESIATIDADIVVVNKINSPRLRAEIHKRHKKIFLSLRSHNESDLAVAQALKNAQKIDGAVIAP